MVGSWSHRTLTGPSTTSSRRRGTPATRTGSSKSIRSWCGRWWPRRRLRRRRWSRPRIVGLSRAGVAHLVERNLPKVEVAGSRPVARSTFVLRSAPSRATTVRFGAFRPALIRPFYNSRRVLTGYAFSARQCALARALHPVGNPQRHRAPGHRARGDDARRERERGLSRGVPQRARQEWN